MTKKANRPYRISSIAELHRLLELPAPQHPLVSVVNLGDIRHSCQQMPESFFYTFYSICIKKDFYNRLKYGQNYYDFDQGVLTSFAPGQVISTDVEEDSSFSGCWLIVHPDFVRNYPLGKKIAEYGFFSYAVHEALHLSEKEEKKITSLMQDIAEECRTSVDTFSQDVIVSHIELLLTYANRFYNRQFITRQQATSDVLTRVEKLLDKYFDDGRALENGIPTVHYISEQLNMSPNYLSDLLRTLTGRSTQQHIHDKLIEKAKESLTTTSLSVGEIAFQLGFEYPQSFSKLFKNKTQVSPLQFRQTFN